MAFTVLQFSGSGALALFAATSRVLDAEAVACFAYG